MKIDIQGLKQRQPAECVVTVDGAEASSMYPFMLDLTVETSRLEPAVGTIRLESRRDELGRWTVQDARVFVPWRRILIEAAFGGYREEVLRGYIREVRADYPEDPSTTTVTVECRDDTLPLDREHVRKTWGAEAPTSDRAILAEILGKYGLAFHEDSKEGGCGLVLNQDGTDICFMRRRAEANGYELIFRGGRVYFGPMRLHARPQPTVMVYAGPATNCRSFSVRSDGHQPDRVAFDLGHEQGSGVQRTVVAPDLPLLGAEPADSRGSGLRDFVWLFRRGGGSGEATLRIKAQAKANEFSMRVRAEGELDGSLYGHVLRAGEPVSVDGVGEWMGGTYYVDSVTHRFSMEGYRQSFVLLRNAYGESTSGLLASVLSEVAKP